jgi:hypothetical protein
MIQTVDKRTVRDLKGLNRVLVFEGLSPKDFSHIALCLLCRRIRMRFKGSDEPLTLLLDEGIKKAGQPFGDQLFRLPPLLVDLLLRGPKNCCRLQIFLRFVSIETPILPLRTAGQSWIFGFYSSSRT